MSITITGFFIIALAFYCFFFFEKLLYGLAIFFVPFTGTAVFIIGTSSSSSYIQPYMFFAILAIVKQIFNYLKKSNSEILFFDKKEIVTITLLLLFVFVVAFSLMMPILIDGKVNGNITGGINESSPIFFSGRNITQYFYFLFGVLFSFIVYKKSHTANSLSWAIKLYGYSVLFVMFWGIFQLVCDLLSLPYPALLFNNYAGGDLEWQSSEFEYSGFKRIFSVAIEPSILAQSVVIYIPFLLVSLSEKNYIFSRIKDLFFLIFLSIFIFLSTSSSGILSFFAAILFFLLSNFKYAFKHTFRFLIIIIASVLGILIFYFLFSNIIQSSILNKSDTYSAIQRFGTINDALTVFYQYPLLGVGWGTITVNDLFIKILSNSGVIGFIVFLLFLFFLFKQHKFSSKKSDNTKKVNIYLNRACILSFLVLLFNCEVAGFSFYFGIFWLVLGFCLVNKDALS